MLIDTLKSLFERDLKRLKSEIESYIKDVASISVRYTKEVKESLQETFYKDKLDENV